MSNRPSAPGAHPLLQPHPDMHIQTHIVSGWCAANLLDLTPRERALAMVAASAADLDGLGRAKRRQPPLPKFRPPPHGPSPRNQSKSRNS